MKTQNGQWSKTELQAYILLMCANADNHITPEEIELIRMNVDEMSFEKIYSEFIRDNENDSLDKIGDAIALHEYSHRELDHLKFEMNRIFLSDKKYLLMELNLKKILDNIIY
ncbi:hypothetical protein MKO06_01685 [Gramella sp. GC03-9]|uniref:Tellurite resistance protein TerB n=1 Tax=Christiangramia oceanisediminis TaxID=2920386 RepID=A0A9X2KVV3_9FLAO|nr:hypothetical protein [Gramella oceanisediminis]MCP9198599.1 hypothetical protein [Gramella oceanisediminis]